MSEINPGGDELDISGAIALLGAMIVVVVLFVGFLAAFVFVITGVADWLVGYVGKIGAFFVALAFGLSLIALGFLLSDEGGSA